MLAKLTDKKAQSFANQVGQVFKNVPHLPKGLVDFLVQVAPWLVGLGGLINLLGGLNMVMGGNTMSRFAYSFVGVDPTYFVISGVISFVLGVLFLMAFSPLKDKKLAGWMYLFWAEMLAVVQSVVAVAYVGGGVVGAVIGLMIGFYVLYELKPAYKK